MTCPGCRRRFTPRRSGQRHCSRNCSLYDTCPQCTRPKRKQATACRACYLTTRTAETRTCASPACATRFPVPIAAPHKRYCSRACLTWVSQHDQCPHCNAWKNRHHQQCRTCLQANRAEHPKTAAAYEAALDIALKRDTPPERRAAARTVLRAIAGAHTTPRSRARHQTGAFGQLIAEALAERIDQ